MLTYGYIREATQAHLDLDEQETQAMHLQERYHIFANEAMLAICAVKPKYDYFTATAVEAYTPIINEGDGLFRIATIEELNWEVYGMPEPNFADDIDTKKWYEGQNIYLLNTQVKMPEDFMAFANKLAWAFIYSNSFQPELFITGDVLPVPTKTPATKQMFSYTGRNTLTFLQAGKYQIPYKGFWYRFKSGMKDDDEIDMPMDILLTIPLYVAAQCLQMDHAQRAKSKQMEFEIALARVSSTDFLDNVRVTPSFK